MNTDEKKLLLIDDSNDLLEVLKIFFNQKGYTVTTTFNGSGIHSLINDFKPDVLLMDVLLNGQDGRQICRELRSSADTKHLGIIITSASPDNLKNYSMYGADDCIEKPFSLDALQQKIESVLSWTPIRKKAHLAMH